MNKPDIIVHPYNMSKVRLEFPNRFGIAYEVKDRFSFFVEGYQFTPKYKANVWDGKIYLFDIAKGLLDFGLIYDLIKWANAADYNIEIHPSLKSILTNDAVNYDKVYDFAKKFLKLPFEPYEYQIDAAVECINKGRLLVESPTSSGKSLIIYIVLYWLKYVEKMSRVVIIVPTVGLVTQMFNDFKEYSKNNDLFLEDDYLLIPNKDNIKRNGSIFTISTWQSLQSRTKGKGAEKSVPNSFFEDIDALIVDEVQNFKGTVTSAIVQKTVNTPVKIGFSGTIANSKTDEMILKGLFGKIFSTVTLDNLTKNNIITKAFIKCIGVKYSKESINELKESVKNKKITYQDELVFIINNEKRNKFISNIALSFKTNSLILFNIIEQGEKLKEILLSPETSEKYNCVFVQNPSEFNINEHEKESKELTKEKKYIIMVTGKTPKEDREAVRELCKKGNNFIILSSFGVFQAGISIKNLHNLLLASPTKSGIRLLQSIGRVLRKNDNKEKAIIIDFFDDMTLGKKTQNYTLKHFLERYKIYIDKNFDVDIKEGITI